jgi:N-acyl-D-aspartate/D-glutamate deacylase
MVNNPVHKPLHRTPPLTIVVIALCWTILASAHIVCAQTYDVVLRNGRVLDPESGLDGIRNIGILGGRIAAISTSSLEGKTMVDATGLVVAPGFIDLHSHGQDPENYRFKAMDGVTTALELEVGAWPVRDWYAAREGKALINFGASVGHIPVRMSVMKDSGTFLPRDTAMTDAATPGQQAEILADLDEGMKQGGLGLGMGLAYTPKATPEEALNLFYLAAKWKRPVFVHMRYPGALTPGVVDSLQEMIADAAITGVAVHIVHINSMANAKTPEALRMIEGARAHGVDITTEAYPYIAGYTEIESGVFNPGWQKNLAITYSDLMWVATGERLTEESFNRYRKQGGPVIIFTNTEEMVRLAMADPIVMIASDGRLIQGLGHPRSAGTYARLLGVCVREQKILTLMEAVRRASLAPAQRLEAFTPQMKNKGRLKVGADADIDVFDPAQVIDKSTYQKPAQYSYGFRYVLVGGKFVVRDGKLNETELPGKGILAK